jgi:phosphatidate cytidylyltransferase
MSDLPSPRVLWTIAGTLAVLAVGSLIRLAALRSADPEVTARRLASLKTWWALALLLMIGLGIGRWGVAVLIVLASGLGLREFFRLTGLDRSDRRGTYVVYGGLLSYDLLVAGGRDPPFVPVLILFILCAARLLSGRTENHVQSIATLFWGWAILAYAPAHALLLYTLPDEALSTAGPEGALLCLLILTATNDIAQALIGRRLGSRPIAPRVSPRKTWEGFAGGVLVTASLAVILLPNLTALGQGSTGGLLRLSAMPTFVLAAALGALLAVCGFLGDLNISAVKRQAGVKDGSRLLPGQGGMIDRIDSLTFTAPVFYYALRELS